MRSGIGAGLYAQSPAAQLVRVLCWQAACEAVSLSTRCAASGSCIATEPATPGGDDLKGHDLWRLKITLSEAFVLRENLGLSYQALSDAAAASPGAMLVAGQLLPGAGSPANNDYKPGFAPALMLKDFKLPRDATHSDHAHTALGAKALRRLRGKRKGCIRLLRITNFIRPR